MPSYSPGQWWVKIPTFQTTCWKLCLYIPLAAPKHNSLTVLVGRYCKRAEVGRELGFMLAVGREADIQKTQRVLCHYHHCWLLLLSYSRSQSPTPLV